MSKYSLQAGGGQLNVDEHNYKKKHRPKTKSPADMCVSIGHHPPSTSVVHTYMYGKGGSRRGNRDEQGPSPTCPPACLPACLPAYARKLHSTGRSISWVTEGTSSFSLCRTCRGGGKHSRTHNNNNKGRARDGCRALVERAMEDKHIVPPNGCCQATDVELTVTGWTTK